MKISSKLAKPKPPTLFDLNEYTSLIGPDGKHIAGRIRTIIDDYYERLSALYFNAQLLRTDSTADYCSDILFQENHYGEIKAVGRSNQAFVYEGRLEKDIQLVASGYRLDYVIWSHPLATTDYSTKAELIQALNDQTECFYRIPFEQFLPIIQESKVEKLNSAYGKHNDEPTYGSGRRLRLSKLTQFRNEL